MKEPLEKASDIVKSDVAKIILKHEQVKDEMVREKLTSSLSYAHIVKETSYK